MNNSDEMKLGCDFHRLDQIADAIQFDRLMAGDERPDLDAYWRGAAKRANDRADGLYVEYLAASSKLHIMQGLALLGWAAVILMALGV